MLNLELIKNIYPFVWLSLPANEQRAEVKKLICMHYLDQWLELNGEHYDIYASPSRSENEHEEILQRHEALDKNLNKLKKEVFITFFSVFSTLKNEQWELLNDIWQSFRNEELTLLGAKKEVYSIKFGPDMLERMAQDWNYEYLLA